MQQVGGLVQGDKYCSIPIFITVGVLITVERGFSNSVIVLLQVVTKMIAIIVYFEHQDEIKDSIKQSVKEAQECQSDFVIWF